MKSNAILLLLLACPILAFSQKDEQIRVISDFQMGAFSKIVPTGPSRRMEYPRMRVIEHPSKPVPFFQDPPNLFSPTSDHYSKTKGTSAELVHVGTEFEANHLFNTIPADPTMAISNDGRIVTIDNSTVGYYKENGDTIVKYGLTHEKWYQDSTMDRGPFDPRVIYDSYSDRFISALIYHSQDYTDSRILLSFSKEPGPDSISWNHYQIHCDSIYYGPNEAMYWLDYPNIAINKDELFISIGVFDRDTLAGTSSSVANLVLQVEKAPGYANAANLRCKEWKNVENTDDNPFDIIVPLGDAFQSERYGPGCFMVSNYINASTNFFWYEVTGDIDDPNSQIIAHLTATSFYYSSASFASQMGGNGGDRIEFGDCRIGGGYYQNGKLHFVFQRSDNGWGEIVYAKINTSNNSFEASTWGGDEEDLNSLYPSIAPFGNDSTEEKSIITFSRTGPTIWPQVCAIAYDSAWSPSATVVKAGLGVLDRETDLVAPWDSLERLGDYSTIQRRYNSPSNACWLVGSYAAGANPNFYGVPNGLNSWVAEVGDSAVVSVPAPLPPQKVAIFPNPMQGGSRTLHVRLNGGKEKGELRIINNNGVVVFHTNFHGSTFSKRIPSLPAGFYYVQLNSKQRKHAISKLIVLP